MPLTIILTLLALTSEKDPTDVCQQARYLLDHHHLAPDHLSSARQLLADFRQRDPGDETALALWSRVNITLGDNASGRAKKLGFYRCAQAAAETLRSLNDLNPEGHLWWAAARGLTGMQLGMMNSIRILPSVKHELERALELDSACPWAYTALGSLYHKLPTIAGGDRGTSRRYLETGLARFPNATDARLELARLNIDEGRWAEARQQLDALVTTADPLDPACFVLCDRPKALKLLRQSRN